MVLVFGIVGMISILIAFILDEFVPSFDTNTVAYNLLNIFGAGLLIYYGISIQGWPFVVLNAVWLSAAVIKLGRILKG